MTANAAAPLMQHYVDNFRRLPWRSEPGAPAPDPYPVWLSEVMLQQTTVAAVAPRFARFMARWPTIDALASAGDEDILAEWAGLGYYARARNLIACARAVVRRGGFPSSAGELRSLPGVGDYTAAAIAAIAFGEPVAVVDTNVTRVVARLHALQTPTESEIRRLTQAMAPAERPGDFAQAMMDLGATICRPGAPLCGECPLRSHCLAHAAGTPEDFPARKAKRARPVRHGIAYWIERNGRVWLVRRPPRGLLGGMAALPGGDWTCTAAPAEATSFGTVSHTFTHFRLELHLVRCSTRLGEGWWHPVAQLAEAGLPTLYMRAAKLAGGDRETALAAA